MWHCGAGVCVGGPRCLSTRRGALKRPLLHWRLPWRNTKLKLSALCVQSLGNDSVREPDDRFGSRIGYNFNNASMGRIGASFIFTLDDNRKWSAEVGYNQWVWGKSARQYDEPFLAFGRRF